MIGFASLLNKQGQIERATRAKNEYAQVDEIWDSVLTFKCAVMQQSQVENMNMSKVSDIASHRIYCEPISVRIDDRIIVDGVYYLVKRINDVMLFGDIMHIDVEVVDGIYQQDSTI